jgi:hypothetical protein
MFIVCIRAARYDNRDAFAGYRTFPDTKLPGFPSLEAAEHAAGKLECDIYGEDGSGDVDLTVCVRQVVNCRLVPLPRPEPKAAPITRNVNDDDDIEF